MLDSFCDADLLEKDSSAVATLWEGFCSGIRAGRLSAPGILSDECFSVVPFVFEVEERCRRFLSDAFEASICERQLPQAQSGLTQISDL